MTMRRSGPAIGIDLGTSFCCVAVWKHGTAVVIPNENGNRITPSYVAFTPSERLIGDAAKNQASSNPENTIFDVKRLMGRRFDDPLVLKDLSEWPFKVVAGSEGQPLFCVKTEGLEKKYATEEISAMLLCSMKDVAEAYLDAEVKDAVITVPAYFTQAQRRATQDAGKIAGLNVLRIVNEPTAAALAFGFNNDVLYEEDDKKLVMVFDLGGGTCDVSIMELGRSNGSTVRALSGDTHLGGVDFDTRLLNHIVERYKGRIGTIIKRSGRMTRLRRACVSAKHDLSARPSTSMEVDPSSELVVLISRATFEELNRDLFGKCMEVVKDALRSANLLPSQISDVILVGGSTRIPKIQSLLTDFFGGRSPKKSVNADEAVGCGAAILAAILTGENTCHLKDLAMVEVTALSLGLGTCVTENDNSDTRVMTTVIPRNTAIPAVGEIETSTARDNQLNMKFYLFEGERALCKDNHFLGLFVLYGFVPAPKGVGKAILTLSVDEDGILHAEARNSASGKTSYATITMEKGRLTNDEIRTMVDEAHILKADDELARKRWSARNELEEHARSVRNRLPSIEASKGKDLEACVDQLLTWLDSSKIQPTLKECEEKRKELDTLWACANDSASFLTQLALKWKRTLPWV